MAKVRLIDTKEEFLLEIDGTAIPHVSTYEISKSVQGFWTMKIVLSVNEVEELGIKKQRQSSEQKKQTVSAICGL